MAIDQRSDVIDIDERPEPRAILEYLRDTSERCWLRFEGRVVATVELTEIRSDGPSVMTTERQRLVIIAADRAALHASAGAWEGIVDSEDFLRNNESSRAISTRPLVEL